MWRFYIIVGIFLLTAAMLFILPLPASTRTILIVTDLLLLVSAISYGAFRINSRVFVPTTCMGSRAGELVAITFDDGPDPANTRKILDILERFQCKASFFLTGSKVPGNETLVKQLFSAGHSIGNHSFSHSNLFPFYRPSRISREIRETNTLLEGITGIPIKYFRPPFGITNPNIYRGLRGSGLHVIGWSIRSYDTRNEEPGKAVQRISQRLRGGDIILLHETSEYILQILEQLLPVIDRRGLQCATLDQMLANHQTLGL